MATFLRGGALYLARPISGWREGIRATHSATVRCVPSFIF